MVSHRFLLRKGPLEKRRERCGEVNSTLLVVVYIIFWFAWCACFFLLLSLYVCFSACSGCMNFFSREFFRVWIFFLSSPFTFPMAHPLKLNGPWKVYHSRTPIGARERMFLRVHRVSCALISLCPLPFETPNKQTIWEQGKFYRTTTIGEFIYLLRNYIVFYLSRRSYLI